MSTMKAWKVEKHGGPEVLQLGEQPLPEPGPFEARVRVRAVGLNHLDLWVRNGVPGHQFPLPLVPGCDIAGEVDQWGSLSEASCKALQASGLKEKSAVVVNAMVSSPWLESTLAGFPPLSADFGIVGEHRDGGCAEYVNVPIQNLVPIPENVTLEEAASLPIAYVTAWSMLQRKAELRAGETILVQAGGSGVSIAAIQMAKLLGAEVITTVGSEEKIEKARQLGADWVIPYREKNFREELKSILKPKGKKGVEVVLDHVGSETFAESLKSLAWGGRLVTCGATSGSKVEMDLKPVFFKNLSILGSTMGGSQDLHTVLRLVAQKKIRAIVDSTFPMEELPEAMKKLEERKAFGKVILKGF